LQFPVVKLLDFTERWSSLEQSDNPFAVIVMAHLKALSTRNNPEERLRWKLYLVKGLYERGFTQNDIIELFRFIDWVMVLPDDLDQSFEQELSRFEEEFKMPYLADFQVCSFILLIPYTVGRGARA